MGAQRVIGRRMKTIVSILALGVVGGIAAAIWGWQEVGRLRITNEALQQKLVAAESTAKESAAALQARHQKEKQRLEQEAREVHKLRGEVNRLRGGADSAARLQEANRQLERENRTLRESATETAAGAAAAAVERDSFPKESWQFLGYASPEDALVSAIWTMQQGDPQSYFESLAPVEQERMARRWQDKTEAEISSKHQSDVAAISGLRVLSRRDVSNHEAVLDVYIESTEGQGRMETVSMQRIGNEWKFAGSGDEAAP